jgi:hypothetical protein
LSITAAVFEAVRASLADLRVHAAHTVTARSTATTAIILLILKFFILSPLLSSKTTYFLCAFVRSRRRHLKTLTHFKIAWRERQAPPNARPQSGHFPLRIRAIPAGGA